MLQGGSYLEPFCRAPNILGRKGHRLSPLQRPLPPCAGGLLLTTSILQGPVSAEAFEVGQTLLQEGNGHQELVGSSGSSSCASMAHDTEPQFLGSHLH